MMINIVKSLLKLLSRQFSKHVPKHLGHSMKNLSGQYHHSAKLTAHDVELIFKLREQGLSIRTIAQKLECSKSHVHGILNGTRRCNG